MVSAQPVLAQTYAGDRYGPQGDVAPAYQGQPDDAAPYGPGPGPALRGGYPPARQAYDQGAYVQYGQGDAAYAAAREQDDRRSRQGQVYRTSFLTWSGKVEQQAYSSESYAYGSGQYVGQGRAGPGCPATRPGERVLSCHYVPFAPPPPPPEAEAGGGDFYADGGVGPAVIGGGGGGGPSNAQEMIGTSANSGYFSFVGVRGSSSSSASGSGMGSGSGTANASSSSASSASASISASLSSSISLSGGFFGHGGGGGHWGGMSGGVAAGWGGGGHSGGSMGGWSGGGRRK
jgi:hypothetical protein